MENIRTISPKPLDLKPVIGCVLLVSVLLLSFEKTLKDISELNSKFIVEIAFSEEAENPSEEEQADSEVQEAKIFSKQASLGFMSFQSIIFKTLDLMKCGVILPFPTPPPELA